MPVELRTIHGAVPYAVEQQIRDLVLAVNTLERQVQNGSRIDPASIARLQQGIADLAAQLASLNQRVFALENP